MDSTLVLSVTETGDDAADPEHVAGCSGRNCSRSAWPP
jgi:hypothetical protein